MKKQGRKPIIYYFIRGKKSLKLSYENGEKNQILIENRNERCFEALDQRLKYDTKF